MIDKKLFALFLRILPYLLLLIISGYFANIAWQKYQKNTYLNDALSNVKLLQTYEQAKLNEALCIVVTSKESNATKELCQERKKYVKTYAKQLKTKDANLESWMHQMDIKKEKINTKSIEKFENVIDKHTLKSALHSYFEAMTCQKGMTKEKTLLS